MEVKARAKRIFLSSPHLCGLERRYVQDAFDSNWIAPLGPHVDAFESELADRVGAAGAAALSSGTAAIHLGLRILGVQPGDTVFCSTATFVATANPILYLGAEPVFIDSEPSSWNMSPIALQRAFDEAERSGRLPRAVIVVDLYGQSADMDPLRAICDRYGVPILEDAAEALGATYKGKSCGMQASLGVFSFNGNKIITTSGGGALVSDDLEALDKARFWATQARDAAPHFQHSELGHNYRMSNVLAAIGRGQLRVLQDRVIARRAVFERYYEALGDIDGVAFMPEASFGRSNRWLTTMTIDPSRAGTSAEAVREELDSYNIEARPVWKPLHLQPLFWNAPFYPHGEEGSVAHNLFDLGLCLPSGSNLTDDDLDFVIERLEHCFMRAGSRRTSYSELAVRR